MRFWNGPALLLIDELGYLPMPGQDASLLFQVISRRYEHGSIVLTTNRGIADWGAIFEDTPSPPRSSTASYTTQPSSRSPATATACAATETPSPRYAQPSPAAHKMGNSHRRNWGILAVLDSTGPKAEAEEIKHRLAQFLHDELKLELSETKTLITHARSNTARFLGYEITAQHDNRKMTAGRRSVNGQIRLRVPMNVIKVKCSQYMKRGQPADRPALMNEQDHAIINRYAAEYRGIVQYYLLAGDVYRLDRLHWVMQTSLLKTLAGKYGSTVTKMAHKYRATIETPHGPHTCLQVSVNRGTKRKALVATFGGIPLRRQKHAVLKDRVPVPATAPRKELIQRLLAGRCEICGQTDRVQVHQIRKLSDLEQLGQPQQPEWMRIMATRRRKTL